MGVIGTKAGCRTRSLRYGGCGKRDWGPEEIIDVDVEMTKDDWSHGGHSNLEEAKACGSLAPRDCEIHRILERWFSLLKLLSFSFKR